MNSVVDFLYTSVDDTIYFYKKDGSLEFTQEVPLEDRLNRYKGVRLTKKLTLDLELIEELPIQTVTYQRFSVNGYQEL